MQKLTDGTSMHHICHQTVTRMKAHMIANGENNFGVFASLNHQLSISRTGGHRLFDKDMFTGASGGDNLGGMQTVGRSHDDTVEIWVSKEGSEIGEDASHRRGLMFVGKDPGACCISSQYRPEDGIGQRF